MAHPIASPTPSVRDNLGRHVTLYATTSNGGRAVLRACVIDFGTKGSNIGVYSDVPAEVDVADIDALLEYGADPVSTAAAVFTEAAQQAGIHDTRDLFVALVRSYVAPRTAALAAARAERVAWVLATYAPAAGLAAILAAEWLSGAPPPAGRTYAAVLVGMLLTGMVVLRVCHRWWGRP